MRPRLNRLFIVVAGVLLLLVVVGLAGCDRESSSQGTATGPTASVEPTPADSPQPESTTPAASGEETPTPTREPLFGLERSVGEFIETLGVLPIVLLVVLGGVLLIVAAVVAYLLTRGSSRRRQPSPGSANGKMLPTGGALNDGRYVILGSAAELAVGPRAQGAVYEVRTTAPLLLCPACHTAVSANASAPAPPPALCPTCGALLSGPQLSEQATTEPPVLIAREVGAEQYAASSELLARQLAHPAIVLPLDVFMEPASETVRYYQVEPKIRNSLASTVKTPQSVSAVLAWGVSLAEGLDYLHQHQVALNVPATNAGTPVNEAGPDDISGLILLGEDEARWLCLHHVGPLDQANAGDVPQIFGQDVRGLAASLLKLATGGPEGRTPNELPDPVRDVLQQALGHDVNLSAADFAARLREQRRELAFQEPARMIIGARSDVGRLRKLNEDNLFVRDYSDLFAPLSLTVTVAAVADGVGGHSAGDVASRLAVEALTNFGETLRRTAVNGHMPDPEPWVVRAATAANRAVFLERKAAASDMGCTLVMALFVGSAATLLNVGDSRAYRLRPQGIRQVTTDHSLVQRLIEIGQLTREEARHHPQKSIIYRVVGDTEDLAYDVYDVILQPGEALLFCSDGLSDMVEDDVLWRVWRAAASPDEACERLIALANEAGGYDNITVVIVEASRG